ncbi:hypothetical protein KNE206_73020 [Kitasatospora sp. NE20-6]|uniref:hypothetical protein n=1 Tax=Kitasatospora sp. NE20-6 TaxID=2859066 RepID=UPI0034DBA73E
MPIVHVTAPASADGRDPERLGALCRAVAEGLGLPHDAVVAVLTPATATVTGAGPLPAWPLAVLHGRARPADAVRAALAGAARALADGWGVPPDQVWAEWRPAAGHEIAALA